MSDQEPRKCWHCGSTDLEPYETTGVPGWPPGYKRCRECGTLLPPIERDDAGDNLTGKRTDPDDQKR